MTSTSSSCRALAASPRAAPGTRPLSVVSWLVLPVHPLDRRRGRRVADRPSRWWPGPVGVVAARGDLQLLADRLDPEAPLVFVDELDAHFSRRSSSAWAKNADAVFKTSFARRSSRLSRSSSISRCASPVVVPGRTPPSISTWVTQLRSVSGLIPSCPATRARAPGGWPDPVGPPPPAGWPAHAARRGTSSVPP
jgi:hypothetical protein